MRYVILFLLLSVLVSCKKDIKQKEITANNYTLSVQKASINHDDFTNKTSVEPFSIHAKNIKFNELVSTIFKDETITVHFQNQDLYNLPLQVSLTIENNTKVVQKEILDQIVKQLSLKSSLKNQDFFELAITDSTKLYKHYANNKQTRVYKSKDSISLQHVSLVKFSKLIKERFDINCYSTNNRAVINYDTKIKDLVTFKANLKEQLGLTFIKQQQLTYVISE
ncbi:hypothetical protein JAO71_09065 [Olleya sp. YSTF-M6]|uniref:Lipoprotein n=1 Tax=Olleya sediminilitoris TaxID=2795739 RepID=A0ABS1WLE2_9FLAO|nr:hypothetical protein [Olleya sediminilitoris]MBL7559951.1 hypothetical protein [Olleya sediminilitoris]